MVPFWQNVVLEVAKVVFVWAALTLWGGDDSGMLLGYCDDGTPSGC